MMGDILIGVVRNFGVFIGRFYFIFRAGLAAVPAQICRQDALLIVRIFILPVCDNEFIRQGVRIRRCLILDRADIRNGLISV